jgi:hypothetical protein
MPPEIVAMQSEAVFAVTAGRNAPPPITQGDLSMPADPLPDLPALGIAAPDPDTVAAQTAQADAALQPPKPGQTPHPQDADKGLASPSNVTTLGTTPVTPQPFRQASLADGGGSG